MTTLIFDASSALKLVTNEPGSEQARVEFAAAPDPTVLDWTALEVANALWKRVRRGETSPEQASLALEAFELLGFSVVAAAEYTRLALAIGIERQHPVYDCAYLAVATRMRATLATSDARLRDVAGASGVAVIWIGET
ncbi:MAG: PIN domain-containing protein [Actinobacteria bacterium]|nr:MAG: PIN domain-containing protein [Actinomycetota bacterium]